MSKFLRIEVEGNVGVVNLDLVIYIDVKKNMKYVEDSKYNAVAYMSSSELDGSGGSLMVEVDMFRGTESACQKYVDWLCYEMDAIMFPPQAQCKNDAPPTDLDPVASRILQVMREIGAEHKAVPLETLLSGVRTELTNDKAYGGFLRSIVMHAVKSLLEQSLIIGTVYDERAHYLLPPMEQNDA